MEYSGHLNNCIFFLAMRAPWVVEFKKFIFIKNFGLIKFQNKIDKNINLDKLKCTYLKFWNYTNNL